jgi:hypothetical protein
VRFVSPESSHARAVDVAGEESDADILALGKLLEADEITIALGDVLLVTPFVCRVSSAVFARAGAKLTQQIIKQLRQAEDAVRALDAGQVPNPRCAVLQKVKDLPSREPV